MHAPQSRTDPDEATSKGGLAARCVRADSSHKYASSNRGSFGNSHLPPNPPPPPPPPRARLNHPSSDYPELPDESVALSQWADWVVPDKGPTSPAAGWSFESRRRGVRTVPGGSGSFDGEPFPRRSPSPSPPPLPQVLVLAPPHRLWQQRVACSRVASARGIREENFDSLPCLH